MPWQYPDNVPSSMKYLKPSIQKKGISIANAILESGGQEGTAIATGIKKAKELHSKVKSFKKTASLNWATDAAEAQSNILHKTQSMNNSVIMPKLSKLRQPTSMNSNFSQIGKISV